MIRTSQTKPSKLPHQPEHYKFSTQHMIKLTSSFTLSLSLAAAPLFSLQVSVGVSAFSAMFPDQQSGKRLTPSAVEGVRIELPDFDVLFQNIREVSPLAYMVLDQDEITGGFAAADEKCMCL